MTQKPCPKCSCMHFGSGRFTWNGGNMIDAMVEIARAGAEYEAAEYIDAYAKFIRERVEAGELTCDDPHERALANIGYEAAYQDSETARLIWETFNTSHPIFGRTIPSPEEAFAAGVKMGEEIRGKRDSTRQGA